MVNAGAIAVANLFPAPRRSPRGGHGQLVRPLRRPAPTIDESVFRSEHETGHRNRAITWMMLNSGMIDRDPDEVLDLYFRQCSVW